MRTLLRLACATCAAVLMTARMGGVSPVLAQATQSPILARTQILITSGGLVINPSHQVVPRNTATIIATAVSAGDPDDPGADPGLPANATVMGELVGPAFNAPIALATRPGEPFHIQPLPLAGLYYVRNIRLESAGATLLTATPDAVTLEVIDQLLVSQVTSRALSAQEIRDRGIVVDQTNFQVVNFTAAFGLQDRKIVLDVPMILPTRADSPITTAVPALMLPALQPAVTPAPAINLPQLVEAFQTPNVSISGLLLKVEDEEVDRAFQLPPIPGIIVIPGNIAYLNQFFSVMLLVSNVAPSGANLTVRDVRAEIVLPNGADTVASTGDDPLRMARLGAPPVEQSKIQSVLQPGPDGKVGTSDDVLTIAPQESGRSEHLVEGAREGVHTVEMKISATLDGLPIGPVPVSGRVLGTVEVRNPTFALTLSHPSTVSAGEEYDFTVTVTNTSSSPANFVSLNLLPRSVAGAVLLSNPSVAIDTIAAGDAQSATFRLRAQISGTVTATSFSSDGVPGRFEFNTAVGALGIPMSPNTLVLPPAADALPDGLRAAGLSFLGQAFALATSPVTPAGRLPLTQQIVYDRATELSQAGQRLGLNEPLSSVARDFLLDWTGSDYVRLPESPAGTNPSILARRQQDFLAFDDLFRRSNRGAAVLDVLGTIFGDALSSGGAGAFFDAWSTHAGARAPQLTALVTGAGNTSPIALSLQDPLGRRTGIDDATGGAVRDMPFAESLAFKSNGVANGQLIVDPSPDTGAFTLSGVASAAGTFDLNVLVPENAGLRQLRFPAIAVGVGARIELHLTVGSALPAYDLAIDDDGNGTVDRHVAPNVSRAVDAGGPHVVSAVQVVTGQPDGSDFGQVLAVLFNQQIDAASAQNGAPAGQITGYTVDANQVLGVAVQPGGRVVLLSLRDGVGPLTARSLTVTGLKNVAGAALTPEPTTVPISMSQGLIGGSIAGRVLHGDGTPVPFAQIRVAVRVEDQDVTVTVKNADAQGKYALDFVPIRPVLIEAIDPQAGERGDVRSAIIRNAQHLDLDVILLGTGSLMGRALSPAGAPLAQAIVRVSSLTRFGDVYSAMTDATGAFAISGVAVGNVTIEAAHVATNAKVILASAIPRAGAIVVQDLVLLPVAQVEQQTGSIAGQVYRADGTTPAAGIPVFTDRGGVATTDASGSYRIDGLPPGAITVRAIDQAHLEQMTVATTVVAREVKTANIRLAGGTGTILGVVLDSDGTPVANAIVGGGATLVRTSGTGEFVLTDVPLGVRTVTALDEVHQLTGSASVTVSIPGEQVRTQVVLEARGSITGHIFESNGTTPVAGLKVFLLGPRNLSAVTDQNGAYRFDQVPVGSYQLSAFRPDFSDGNIMPTKVVFRGEVRVTDVTFRGRGRVTGTVLAANGTTGLAATVGLTELKVKAALLRPAENPLCRDNVQVGDITVEFPQCESVGIGFTTLPVSRTLATNPNTGRFAFEDVFVGAVTIQAGGLNQIISSASGTITAPGQTLDLPIRLTADSAARGTVFLPGGQTAGADVVVTYNGANVTTDATGRFLHAFIAPGYFQLTARDPATGFVGQVNATVPPGVTADVPIRLLGRGRVNVLVTGSNGPVAHAAVRLQGGGYPFDVRQGVADTAGRVTFDGGDAVTEGPFSVTATDPVTGVVGSTSGAMPASNASVDVSIALSDEVGTVSGHLFGPDGTAKIRDAQIKITSAGGDAFTTTDPDGAFRFEGVRRGHVSLEAFHAATARRGRAEGDIVSNHGEVTIDIVEAPQGRVRGVVQLSTDQSAVAGAAVSLSVQSPFGGQYRSSTGPDGTFSFPGVSAGDFTVSASDETRGLSGSASGKIQSENEEVVADIVLQVPARGRVQGHVLTAGGAPAFGAQLTINGNHTTVDNSGAYSFDNLPVGDVSVLALSATGNDAGVGQGRLAFDGDVATLDVHLIGTGSVTGTVSSAGGAPVPFARVTLNGHNALNRSVAAETQSDGQGRFRFDDVLVGDVTVSAVQTGTNLAGSGSGTLAAAGATVDLPVTLQPAGSVAGRVVRQDGSTAAAGMALELNGPARRFGSTAGSGTFTFGDLPLGSYTLTASDPLGSGLAIRPFTLATQGQSLDLGNVVLDEAPPHVTAVIPAAGSVGIPVTQPIKVEFSEAIDAATVTSSTLLVASGTSTLAGNWAVAPDGRSAVFTPTTGFADFAAITVKITTGVRDRVGKALESEAVSTFTTADSTPPATVTVTPIANALGVQPQAVVRVGYSEAVNPVAFGGAAIAVVRAGVPVAGRVDFALGNTVVVFTPSAPLAPNATYNVLVAPAADVFGNRQVQGLAYKFDTLDTIPPAVQRLVTTSTDVFEGSLLNVSADLGTAGDVASVEFLVAGQVVRTDAAAPYDLALPIDHALSPSFVLGARATDTSGNVGPLTTLSIAVRTDQPPSTAITSPADGATVQPGASVTVHVHSTDDRGVSRVSLQASGAASATASIDVTPAATAHDAAFTVNVPSSASGTLTIRAVATDTQGATSATATTSLSVTDSVAPTVSLVSPSPDVKLASGTPVTLVVDAIDNSSVASIELTATGVVAVDETHVISPPAPSARTSFTVTIPGTATSTDHLNVTLNARDAAGNQAPPVSVTFAIKGPIGTLRGFVRTAALAPIPAATVDVTGPETAHLVTSPDGSFTADVVPGHYVLSTSRAGTQGTALSVTAEADVATGTITNRDLTFPRTASVSGTVTRSNGAPAVSATVDVSAPGFTRQTSTDPAGHYLLIDVPDGGYALTATHVATHGSVSVALTVAGIDLVRDLVVQTPVGGGGADTDGDGLSDGDEIRRGTDPTRADTDGDGFSDGVEVAFGSDPLSAASRPAFRRWTGTDVTGRSNWFSPLNWSPAGVPTAADNVFIPSGLETYPALTAQAVAGSIVLEGGATIQMGSFRLVANGNVFSDGAMQGTENLEMNGGAALARGNLPSVVASGNITFVGATTIDGTANVTGRFDIADQHVRVTRNLTIFCGPCTGQLRMTDPSGLLVVDRDVVIDGQDTEGWLTAGELRVGGNFFVGGSTPLNLAATGDHLTVFDGTSPQTIQFCCGGGRTSRRFNNVILRNPAGVSLLSDVYAGGDLMLQAGATLAGVGTFSVDHDITTEAGTTVSSGGIGVGRGLAAQGTFSPGTTTFFGSDQLIPGGLAYNSVTITGSTQLGGTATMQGNMLLLGRLDINGRSLRVTGNLTIPCGPCTGALKMADPAGSLTIDGGLSVDGVDTEGLLTAGELHLRGAVFVGGSTPRNFSLSEALVTFFDGTTPQAVQFCCGTASRHFGRVIVTNASGVSMNSDVAAAGDLVVRQSAVLTGPGTLSARNVTTEATSSVTLGGLIVSGVLQANGLFAPFTTTFAGAGQMIPGGLAYRNITVTGSAQFAGPATVQGNVLLHGGLDLNGQSVHVTGSLSVPCGPCTGQLRMTAAGGVLIVDQDVSIDGLDTQGALTAGEFHVGRNLFVGGSAGQNFAASGTHTTVFDGTGAQNVMFCCGTGATTRHFGHVVIANSAGVSLNSEAYALGDLVARSNGALAGVGTLMVAGNVSTEAGTNVAPGGLGVGGLLSAAGTFSPGTTFFTGTGQTVPGGLAYRNVTVLGSVRMGGPATLQGTLLLHAPFDLAGQQVHVTGSLSIPCGPCSGLLRMTDTGGILKVDQDVAVDGLDTNGLLTRGELHVGRNFFVGGSTRQNFAASEQHLVVFDGSQPQLIQFCCGVGASSRYFANLSIAAGASVSVQSGVLVTGLFTAKAGTLPRPILLGNGQPFDVADADIDGAVFDNVGLSLNPGLALAVRNAVFRNYPASATQLTINASSLSATFTGLQFLSPPDTGAYIRATDLDGPATLAELTIADSLPKSGLAKTVAANGFVVHWGSAADDTDGDGLTDADELNVYHTDPVKADTDGDGAPDNEEIAIGSNPRLGEVCVLPPLGLVSWWPGDGDMRDVAGNSPGTVFNTVTFVPGRVGSAFHFDGNSAVEAPATGLPSGSAPRTVEFWMRPELNARAAFFYGNPAAGDAFYPIVKNDVACMGQWGGGAVEVCGTTVVTDGLWHHLAMTYDGATTASLYIDGNLDATVSKVYNTTGGGTVRIGGPFGSGSDFFRGDLDEVAIYARALQPSEIRALVTASRAGKCPGVVGDARHEYSLVSNPNGNWTYGASHTLGGDLVPYTRVEGQVWLGAPGIAESSGTPSVALTAAGALAFHPGPAGDLSVIRWHAPRSGTFQVDVTFSAGDTTTTDVHVLVNGASIFDGAILGASARQSFRSVVTLTPADSLDFAVGIGGGDFLFDTTLIDVRITQPPATPPQ